MKKIDEITLARAILADLKSHRLKAKELFMTDDGSYDISVGELRRLLRKLLRLHGMDKLEDLYRRIAGFIAERGGSAVVIGGVEVMKFPSDPEYNYRLCFKITGKCPKGVSDAE